MARVGTGSNDKEAINDTGCYLLLKEPCDGLSVHAEGVDK